MPGEENPYKKIYTNYSLPYARLCTPLSFFFLFLLLALCPLRSLLIHDATSRVCYNSRTALIILLFSNESVDADGSTPAHKMHGTGCVSSSSLLLSFSSFLAVSLKSLLPGSLAREREREHVPRV